MKNRFLRTSFLFFLGLSLTAPLVTSCSNDDSANTTIEIHDTKLKQDARKPFTIDPKIDPTNTQFSWFDNTTQKVISNAPVLEYQINKAGTHRIALKTTKAGVVEMYSYTTTVAYTKELHSTLDLSKIELTLPTVDGSIWSNTFTANTKLETSPFIFNHLVSNYDGVNYWSGFTVSNSTDKKNQKEAFATNMYGTMAETVSRNKEGKTINNPFIVANTQTVPADIKKGTVIDIDNTLTVIELTDAKDLAQKFIPEEMFIAINPYTYYSVTKGDGFGKKFEKGDFYNIHIFALNENKEVINEKPIVKYLVDFTKKVEAIDTTWQSIDLAELGEAKYLVFYADSSDKGDYGINTPAYFTINKLVAHKLPKK